MSDQMVRQREAHIAFTRFGLGARRNRFSEILSNPRRAVLMELNRPAQRLIHNADLPTHAVAGRASENGQRSRGIYRDEIMARLRKQMQPEVGFVERLVMFWTNHFFVNAGMNGPARAMAGEMERNRIRRHVLGNFRDMLGAVISHPAMIHSLQNGQSIGPNSPFGRNGNRGLNENLARELLELHTVGVSAGYTQQDVENTARILTGWSVVTPWQGHNGWHGGTPQTIGRFIFRQNWQEPGAFRVMGRTYGQPGIRRVWALLDDLALHPSTAQHIAFKLVKHFITDTPTPAMVNPVARAFLRSGGDLAETARALVRRPAAWRLPARKIRTPYELFVAQRRALGVAWTDDDFNLVMAALGFLSHRPWEWDFPDGFPDDSDFWLTPDAAVNRLGATQAVLRRVVAQRPNLPPAARIAAGVLGQTISAATLRTIRGTDNNVHALAGLFLSPEFQRR